MAVTVPAIPRRRFRFGFFGLLSIFLFVTFIIFMIMGTVLANEVSRNFLSGSLNETRNTTGQYLQLRAGGLISPTNLMAERKMPMSDAHRKFTNTGRAVWGGLPYYSVKVWSPSGGLVWSDRDQVLADPPAKPTTTVTLGRGSGSGQGGSGYDDPAGGKGTATTVTTLTPALSAPAPTPPYPTEPTDPALLRQALAGRTVSQLCSLSCQIPAEQSIDALLNIYVPIYAAGGNQIVGVIEVAQDVSTLYLDMQARQRDLTVTVLTFTVWLYVVLFLVLLATSAAINYYQGREQHRSRSLRELQRQFSPAVAQAILGGEPMHELTGRVEATVLFVDIRGFTNQAATLPAEQVIELLNQYMTVGTRVVFQFNGVVDKFLGDGILAVFGAPAYQPDHALRGAAAALTLRRELAALNRQRKSEGQPPIRVGMSLATGTLVAGNIGSDAQQTYTVIGDPVNVASRLVGLAEPDEILLTAATAQQIGEQLQIEGGDNIPVRGREEAVAVYWLPEQPISGLLLDGLPPTSRITQPLQPQPVAQG